MVNRRKFVFITKVLGFRLVFVWFEILARGQPETKQKLVNQVGDGTQDSNRREVNYNWTTLVSTRYLWLVQSLLWMQAIPK